MKKKDTYYHKPKIKVKKIALNMYFSEFTFPDEGNMFFASCWNTICKPCGLGCGSDCAC